MNAGAVRDKEPVGRSVHRQRIPAALAAEQNSMRDLERERIGAETGRSGGKRKQQEHHCTRDASHGILRPMKVLPPHAPSVELNGRDQPHESEEITPEDVARPVLPGIDARETHERDHPKTERDHSCATDGGAEPNGCEIAYEPQKRGDVQDVAGREGGIADLMCDVNEGRRLAKPHDKRLHHVLQTGSAQRGETGREPGPSAPDDKDHEDQGAVEDRDEGRESERAEAAERNMEPSPVDALHCPRDLQIDRIMGHLMRGDGEQHRDQRCPGAEGAPPHAPAASDLDDSDLDDSALAGSLACGSPCSGGAAGAASTGTVRPMPLPTITESALGTISISITRCSGATSLSELEASG